MVQFEDGYSEEINILVTGTFDMRLAGDRASNYVRLPKCYITKIRSVTGAERIRGTSVRADDGKRYELSGKIEK